MKGAIAKAEELAASTPGAFLPGQFSIPPIPPCTAPPQGRRFGRIRRAG